MILKENMINDMKEELEKEVIRVINLLIKNKNLIEYKKCFGSTLIFSYKNRVEVEIEMHYINGEGVVTISDIDFSLINRKSNDELAKVLNEIKESHYLKREIRQLKKIV